MKQKYVKPQFLAESFSLSQSVALGCAPYTTDSANHHSPQVCGWLTGYDMGTSGQGMNYVPDGTMDVIFLSGSQKCNIILTDAEAALIYGMCYNNPDGATKVFAS